MLHADPDYILAHAMILRVTTHTTVTPLKYLCGTMKHL